MASSAKKCLFPLLCALALLWGVWELARHRAAVRAEKTLAAARREVPSMFGAIADSRLSVACKAVLSECGSSASFASFDLSGRAARYGVDDIWLCGGNGVALASTAETQTGERYNFGDNEETEGFCSLLNEGVDFYTQPFQSPINGRSNVKLYGVPAPGRDGFAVASLSEESLAKIVCGDFREIVRGWAIGEEGYFLLFGKDGECLLAPEKTGPDAVRDAGRALAEMEREGFALAAVGGKAAKIHPFDYGETTFVAVAPMEEYLRQARFVTISFAIVEIAVFVLWFLLFGRKKGVEVTASVKKTVIARLAASVLLSFAATFVLTWISQASIVKRQEDRLLRRNMADIENAVGDTVDRNLLEIAKMVCDKLQRDGQISGRDLNSQSLRLFAADYGICEIVIVDSRGIVTGSSEPAYIGYDMAKNKQSAEFLKMLDPGSGIREFAQKEMINSAGKTRKYVGIPLEEGFLQVAYDRRGISDAVSRAVVGLTRAWHVGEAGTVAIADHNGIVVSNAASEGEGKPWGGIPENVYCLEGEIYGYKVYVMSPHSASVPQRNRLIAISTGLNAMSLALVAALVYLLVVSVIRAQLAAQQAKDMEMAREIQLSSLPRTFPPFPHETAFGIYATMDTAKEVGGDFYDFYFTGPRKVFFLVADVSGKGIPAALFMMRAKVLVKSLAQSGKSVSEVISLSNDALCEGNDANMFVTVWAAELNLDSGILEYVNAGHNPPAVIGKDGKARFLASPPGLFMGAMGDVPYVQHTARLEPGETIYLYTDGITEQPGRNGAMFGEEALLACLERAPESPEELLPFVLKTVFTHANGAEQMDDCTQLAVKYRGSPAKSRFEYEPRMESLPAAAADLENALMEVPIPERMQLMVAADEIFANIVKHSKATRWSLTVEICSNPAEVRLVFADDGTPFDPLRARDPDITLSAEERSEGGLGILIVKKTMSPVTYTRSEGLNVLTMCKRISGPDAAK